MIYLVSNNNWMFDNAANATVEDCIEYLNSINRISLDTETTGLDAHTCKLLTLQLGDKFNQYIIDCESIDILEFKHTLENKVCLAQNMKFDYKFLYHAGIDIKKFYDTFLIETILTTGYEDDQKDLSLKGLALKYLNVDIDKSVRGQIHKGMSEKVILYAATDIKYLEDILLLQLNQIIRWKLMNILELEMLACRCFAIQEYNGITLDKSKINDVIEELSVTNEKVTKDLDSLIVDLSKNNEALKKFTKVQLNLFTEDIRRTTINWNSPSQKKEILNILGFETDTVNDKYLQKGKNKHVIFKQLIEQSKFAKLENTFGEKLVTFINRKTNRVHPEVRQIVSTGRISVKEPPLQQIPSHSVLGRKIKACFVPREGYKIVSSDLSGKSKNWYDFCVL